MRQTDYKDTESQLPAPQDARENVLASLKRGLPELQPALFPHDGTIVLCGSGPSLTSFADDIRKEREKRRPIVAIKGAHDFLCKQGIEPDLFVSVEAKSRLENVQHKNQHTLYLLSSRCSPELFDHLSDCKVMVFHTYDDKSQKMPEMEGKQLIGGGTTSGMRAVVITYLLGYSKQILYGFDSCLAPDLRKRYDSGSMKKEQITDRWIRGQRFLCNGAMAMQADECQEYLKILPDLKLDFKGEGLLAAIWAERKRLGRSGVL